MEENIYFGNTSANCLKSPFPNFSLSPCCKQGSLVLHFLPHCSTHICWFNSSCHWPLELTSVLSFCWIVNSLRVNNYCSFNSNSSWYLEQCLEHHRWWTMFQVWFIEQFIESLLENKSEWWSSYKYKWGLRVLIKQLTQSAIPPNTDLQQVILGTWSTAGLRKFYILMAQ